MPDADPSEAGSATPRRRPGHPLAGIVPAPVGLPGCRLCPYRRAERPDVCLSCLLASPGQQHQDDAVPRCAVCGQSLPASSGGVRGPCPTAWCGRASRPWTVAWSVGAHAGGLRRAILRYKYGGERWWAGVFARLLAGYLRRHAGWFDDFGMIIPVPSYTGAGGRRTWDPVGEIAAAAAPLVRGDWEVPVGALVKRCETPAMGRAGGAGDREQVTGEWRRALAVDRRIALAGRRVILLDDVLTEGSTAAAVAGRLRDEGVDEVAVLVLARADWQGGSRLGARSTVRSGG